MMITFGFCSLFEFLSSFFKTVDLWSGKKLIHLWSRPPNQIKRRQCAILMNFRGTQKVLEAKLREGLKCNF